MAGIANRRYKPERAVTARTVVLDFLSNRGTREIPARTVLAAGALFGFSEQNLRMALARLVEEGVAANSGRGRYRLAPPAAAMRAEVRKWKHVADLVRPWNGEWIVVVGTEISRADRAALRRHERAIRLRGLREFMPGLSIRPANLRDTIPELRAHLATLGLHRKALVAALSGLDAGATARAARLWNTAAMRREYSELCAALEASRERVPRLPLESAAIETMLLGRDVIRHINLDPLLPEELMPQRYLHELVRAMITYDEIGREVWRRVMRRIENRK